ncbi:MAG: transcription antitermination factor NusB [Syntrophomonadaceae bacterium]|nr:transcription antitermination factor NusB [Syntrophomonadaceae bacterium]
MSRRKAREIAFKILFQVDQINADPQTAFDLLLAETPLQEKDQLFSWELIRNTLQHLDEIDALLSKHSDYWLIKHFPAVDRSIMRVASCEIVFMNPAQAVVAIDEAIEIAKRYGDESSAGFINAVLDKVFGGL